MIAVAVTWEISIIGLSLSLFTVMNLFTKADKQKTDLLFLLWLLVLNIPLLLTIFTHSGIELPLLRKWLNPGINLLQGPLLYLYVTLLISKKPQFQPVILVHLLPFALFYLLFITLAEWLPMLPSLNPPDLAVSTQQKGSMGRFFLLPMEHFALINTLLFLGYSLANLSALTKHQKQITGYFSQKDNTVSLRWIYTLPAIFLLLLLVNIINENNLGVFPPIAPLTLHLFSYLAFIILLCFFGVQQKAVFAGKEVTVETKEKSTEQQPLNKPDATKAVADAMDKQQMASILTSMQLYMDKNKPYLNPDFSVYHLAEALKIPRRTLSYLLNNALGKNFFQYVNEYRIKEVKALLQDSKEKATILDLAFRSGFKSKSSFNSLFKQYCGVTPSQYRANSRKNS